ncbi:MAG: hypothetical protein JSW29_00175 [Candidatus Bathyarchaeota archaeon]|nr:MAG: hypothetical protein JSW29_00175 [Candidatus Bathyarchaeota archaeon]
MTTKLKTFPLKPLEICFVSRSASEKTDAIMNAYPMHSSPIMEALEGIEVVFLYSNHMSATERIFRTHI